MAFKFNLILAKTEKNGIGLKNRLPWNLKKELNYFQKMTKSVENPKKMNAVVMGRLTWDSMPLGFKPLSNRLNVVLSSQKLNLNGALHFKSLKEAVSHLKDNENIETTWIIGGAKVYEAAILEEECYRIYMTHILHDFECDTFVNIDVSNGFKEVSDDKVPQGIQEENGVSYIFKVYEKINK